jgi:hypothetical protein
MDTNPGDRGASTPFRCARCAWNRWRIFLGERLPDGTIEVRHRCANEKCGQERGSITKHWPEDDAPWLADDEA